jgi:hypothetical protein
LLRRIGIDYSELVGLVALSVGAFIEDTIDELDGSGVTILGKELNGLITIDDEFDVTLHIIVLIIGILNLGDLHPILRIKQLTHNLSILELLSMLLHLLLWILHYLLVSTSLLVLELGVLMMLLLL